MPSSDRFEPSRDRHQGTAAAGTMAGAKRDSEPPQYFDPSEPWDVQSAEALTRLYESGEADLHNVHEGHRARRRQSPPHEIPSGQSAGEALAAGEALGRDHAWLEARLTDIAQRLQDSLAEINPDKALAPLNRRLDLIEERFNEALGKVAQRSDLDGLRLIEAHVLELAAHIEQTRGGIERIDAIGDQVRGLERRVEDGDQRRLDALEKLLQDYMAEWRRGDERTASALHTLEDAVARVGESVEAMEAHKPAPDLSMSMLGAPGLGDPEIENDPLSQVYADTARGLGPKCYRSPLDAADYAPKADAAAENPLPPPSLAVGEPSAPPADQQAVAPATEALAPPAFRALAMRAKLRQAQVLSAEAALVDEGPQRVPATATGPDAVAPRRTRPGFLLAAGVTLLAAGGYLLVDVLMTTPATPPRTPAEVKQGARPADSKTARVEFTVPPYASADPNAPDPGPGAGDHTDDAPAPMAPGDLQKAPSTGGFTSDEPPSVTKVARIEAIGSAIAAVFRGKAEVAPPPVETASIQKDAPAAIDDAASMPITMLPMTIGPASLRQAAMRGDPTAQVEVAARFAAGHGVARDLQQAFQWYGRAAVRGLALAQYRLAALYERGLGTAADPERARVWYARAAEQGNVKSMHNLAVLSVSGGRADYKTAAKWFAQAADFGLTDSQFNLAVLYQNGLGVTKDLPQAYKWMALAARGGDREATTRIAQVKAGLTPAQLQATDAGIAAWRARTPDPQANEAVAIALDPKQ